MNVKEYLPFVKWNTKAGKLFLKLTQDYPDAEILMESMNAGCLYIPNKEEDIHLDFYTLQDTEIKEYIELNNKDIVATDEEAEYLGDGISRKFTGILVAITE